MRTGLCCAPAADGPKTDVMRGSRKHVGFSGIIKTRLRELGCTPIRKLELPPQLQRTPLRFPTRIYYLLRLRADAGVAAGRRELRNSGGLGLA
jgi:hypothetical protein